MTGIVALYIKALLGIACLICHWRQDHGDGMALSVLMGGQLRPKIIVIKNLN
jgi:hypothetical protein